LKIRYNRVNIQKYNYEKNMQLRRTKIIATLGPATDDIKIIDKIIAAGIDLVRLNFSHGTIQDHKNRIENLRSRSDISNRQIGIIADLQGPKIRIHNFKNGSVWLNEGQKFLLDINCDPYNGDELRVGITYKNLYLDLKPSNVLLLDDGRIELKVEKILDKVIHCVVVMGGTLSDRKGINLLGGGLSAEALTDKDKSDIKNAVDMDIDYFAISFPSSAKDIQIARHLLDDAGMSECKIIAKIERAEAVKNHEEIIKVADAVMVARGDLGIEIGDAAVPAVQKMLIKKARVLNKISITATQMMESMITSPIPTRAEISDVANAVLDGTDAIMLSAETAAGKYPDKAVAAMNRICLEIERQPTVRTSDHRMTSKFQHVDEAIAMATMYTANHLNVKAIAALTETGNIALWLSRISSDIPIFALSFHLKTCRQVTLYRGVYPINLNTANINLLRINEEAVEELRRHAVVHENDLVIVTAGDLTGIQGGTNLMKIVKVI
jgi:pyruvate kinase